MDSTDLDTGTGPLGPGSVLDGRFRLASVAARTQTATIFNALDERSRQRVRVRVTTTPPEPALLRLAHAAFPVALATGQLARLHWVALEWFDGEPLRLPDLPLARAGLRDWAQLALHLLDALQHLHRVAGRAHGALGLDSLWLGADGRVRILDATAPDAVLSPQAVPWASPERLRGQPREPRSDLYAVGSLLYGLARGVPPFGSDPIDARAGHLLRRVPDCPALTAPFLGVLREAMDKQPDHRFASAAKMREAIEAALGELDPDRRPPLVVAPPAPLRGTELPPASTEEEEEEEEEELPLYGTLEPAPVRRAPRRSPLPMLVIVAGLGLPLSIAAWVALMGLLAALAAG